VSNFWRDTSCKDRFRVCIEERSFSIDTVVGLGFKWAERYGTWKEHPPGVKLSLAEPKITTGKYEGGEARGVGERENNQNLCVIAILISIIIQKARKIVAIKSR
jgi:hypothetical protein